MIHFLELGSDLDGDKEIALALVSLERLEASPTFFDPFLRAGIRFRWSQINHVVLMSLERLKASLTFFGPFSRTRLSFRWSQIDRVVLNEPGKARGESDLLWSISESLTQI